ncbi:MAG: hypothetical protein ACPG80_05345 [Rickettsiales bacterium]
MTSEERVEEHVARDPEENALQQELVRASQCGTKQDINRLVEEQGANVDGTASVLIKQAETSEVDAEERLPLMEALTALKKAHVLEEKGKSMGSYTRVHPDADFLSNPIAALKMRRTTPEERNASNVLTRQDAVKALLKLGADPEQPVVIDGEKTSPVEFVRQHKWKMFEEMMEPQLSENRQSPEQEAVEELSHEDKEKAARSAARVAEATISGTARELVKEGRAQAKSTAESRGR